MSQQLIMTPQLQQAIKLLQLSRIELEELIDQNLIENPTLELSPVEDEDDNKEEKEEQPQEAKSLLEEQAQLSYDDEWQNYIKSGAGVMQDVRSRLNDSDDMSNPLEATISKSNSLMDHLHWQFDMSSFSGVEKDIAEYLIGNIDTDGYLSVSLREMLATNSKLFKLVESCLEENTVLPYIEEEIIPLFDLAHETRAALEIKKKGRKKQAPSLDEDEVQEEPLDLSSITDEMCGILETLLRKIQKFDPPGVGARTLQECLINQLIILKLPPDSLSVRILRENMQLLEQKDLKRIARLQKADIKEVVKSYQVITELEPKPGRPFGGEVTQYVIPDVFIYKRGSEYVVNMNQETIPRLRINPYYQNMLKAKKDESGQGKKNSGDENQDMTFQYILEKVKSGDWLMKSIEQRQKTIFRVAKSILKFQYEFFEKGIDYLKPLVLKDVAEDIEVHESTVSRITTNKYVYTPQGIFELKYFFTSGIDQGDGDIISSKKIKDYIGKLIDTENKKKPFTDLQIKNKLLDDAGIKVARRTVAKYREAMNILPSNKRKKLY